MPRLEVTIRINGEAAKRLYVEHVALSFTLGTYITDDSGRVRDNVGDLGIDSITNDADIRILGQNSVAKVVRNFILGTLSETSVNRRVRDGTIINLRTPAEFVDQFHLLNMAIDNYDNVHRKFPPFANIRTNPDFPLGRQRTLQATKNQTKRIEIAFPDNFPPDLLSNPILSFTEPAQFATSYPLIHVKPQDRADLFRSLIPSEFSHALHFSGLTGRHRTRITVDYLSFITGSVIGGHGGTHALNVRTTPMVAYLDAMDHFSARFSEFLQRPSSRDLTIRPLYRAFIDAELINTDTGNTYWLGDRQIFQVGTKRNNIITPGNSFRRGDVEGAVYGAIFLDFAERVAPAVAIGTYHQSQALTFGEYRNWIVTNMPLRRAAINEVARTWRL